MHVALFVETHCTHQGHLLCPTVVELRGPVHLLQEQPTEPVQPHSGSVMKTVSFPSYRKTSSYDLKTTCACDHSSSGVSFRDGLNHESQARLCSLDTPEVCGLFQILILVLTPK